MYKLTIYTEDGCSQEVLPNLTKAKKAIAKAMEIKDLTEIYVEVIKKGEK